MSRDRDEDVCGCMGPAWFHAHISWSERGEEMAKATSQQKAAAPKSPAGNQPAMKFRRGRVSATAWRNHHETQGVWYSVTVTRSYKDGEQWKSATSFGRDDLLAVGEVCRLAWHWIWEETQRAGAVGEEDGAPPDAP